MNAGRVGSLRLRFAWRAGVLALVLSAAVGLGLGLFWQARVRDAIHAGVADHLRALEAEVDLGAVPKPGVASPVVLPSPERFVQLVTVGGDVVASSSELTTSLPLLPLDDVVASPGELATTITDPNDPGHQAFVMGRIINVGEYEYMGIVGASLGPVNTGRRFTYLVVGVGAPLLGLLVAAGVWIAVTMALRPVNEMTEQADRLAKGSASWHLGVQPDTVELMQLAGSLDNLLNQIRDAFERERRFLDDASHELRTPITVARSELDLAQSVAMGHEDVQQALASALEELDRLDRLAADLLVLARARGAQPGSFQSCDLAGITRRAASAAVRGSGGRRVNLSVSGEASALGDEQALARAIANVLSNAVEFSAERVDVTLEMNDGEALVAVSDDGPGFPEGFLEAAFDRFAKVRSRDRKGAGLGLAIASAIVKAHSGTIEASNVPDGGARVTIRLPRGLARGPHPSLDRAR